MVDFRVLGIVPARAGSKGVPHKNTRILRGKPLIHWAANALMNAEMPDMRICSTDCLKIADCVTETGIEIPWLRPADLATDSSSTVDVLVHALRWYQEQDVTFTHIVLVQPTSPTVLAEDIDAAIRIAVKENADTVISGYQTFHAHPSLMYSLNNDQQVSWLLPDHERKSCRQDLSTVFIRTGLVYVARADLILDQHSIYGKRIFSLEIPEHRSICIDTEDDFLLAEIMLEEMEYDKTRYKN